MLGPRCFVPLVTQAVGLARADHLDNQFTTYILNGMQRGFHIGSNPPRKKWQPPLG